MKLTNNLKTNVTFHRLCVGVSLLVPCRTFQLIRWHLQNLIRND